MTPEQEQALRYLENAIFATRKKGRLGNIRRLFKIYKETLHGIPWWKRFLKRLHITRHS